MLYMSASAKSGLTVGLECFKVGLASALVVTTECKAFV